MPVKFARAGKNSKNFFNKKGYLRRIPELHYWPLKSVLIEKYFKDFQNLFELIRY